ncbi:hypothetical protein U9M48_020792 [Paspalum notatum var. saurae]|uniref:Uncharacterized protein n=1 Tax=Paspalum notatum var. saurae TaxID=547442 RepID=A0AAQ3THQ5_PASNO
MPRLPPFPTVATPLLCSHPTEHPALLLPPDWSSASLPPIHEQQQQVSGAAEGGEPRRQLHGEEPPHWR